LDQFKLLEKWYDLAEHNKNIDDFCSEENISLTRNDKINLLSNLVRKDVFRYSALLSNSIPLVADTDNLFLEFLEEIIRVTEGDKAIGWFEMALIRIGKENNTLGKELTNKMKNSILLFDFSSTPLGGVGYSNFSKIEKIVNSMLISNDPKEVVLGLRAIRIAFNRKELDSHSEIFSKIEKSIKIKNEIINLEAAAALLELYASNPIFCQKHLCQLAKSGEKFKIIILNYLWMHPINNPTNAIALIQECYDPTNLKLHSSIFYALSNYTKTNYKTNYKEIMTFIRMALENNAHTYGHLEHIIKELGKNALFPSLKEFEGWLNTDNFHLKFSIPRFLAVLIPKGQRNACFSYLEKWSEDKSISADLFLKIYKRLLATCYGNNSDKNFVVCFGVITKSIKYRRM